MRRGERDSKLIYEQTLINTEAENIFTNTNTLKTGRLENTDKQLSSEE